MTKKKFAEEYDEIVFTAPYTLEESVARIQQYHWPLNSKYSKKTKIRYLDNTICHFKIYLQSERAVLNPDLVFLHGVLIWKNEHTTLIQAKTKRLPLNIGCMILFFTAISSVALIANSQIFVSSEAVILIFGAVFLFTAGLILVITETHRAPLKKHLDAAFTSDFKFQSPDEVNPFADVFKSNSE